MRIHAANYRTTPVVYHSPSADGYSMTEPKGTVALPVHVTPSYNPNAAPAPGCDVCAALDKQRLEAREREDCASAAIAGVEIMNHPHTGRRRSS